ncbi:K+/H+ antiporter subunit F [Stutzerimonas azotifigens]|uniref:K+/H+ antiporter subunit F n=1 Tax=Stutzerimonas azotifigens TaxID=291995 RepID=UPI0004024031|nr:K+/H+ antiporter subunit F [Stutzerimonas azotifigens]
MLEYVIPFCMAVMGVAATLNVVRLIQGPSMPDRVLALDTFYINALAVIVLFGIWLNTDLFFEAALLIAVMGFVGTVAVAKHLLNGDIID